MKKTLFLFIAFLLLEGCHTASFLPSVPEKSLKTEIDRLLADSVFAQTTVSVKIVSLDNKEVLYNRNASLLLLPASTLKIFTTAAALGVLEETFTFKTALFTDTVWSDGTAGKIYLKGYGDPDLQTSDMDTLAVRLAGRGVSKIRDGIYADASFFDDQPWGMGWMWDDEPDPDEACISALSVNKNCIEVSIRPGVRVGDPAIITLNPQTSFVQLSNSTETVSDQVRQPLKLRRPSSWPNTIIVEGDVSFFDAPKTVTLSLRRPELYAGQLLKEAFLRHSIVVGGSLNAGTAPAKALPIVIHESPLDSVLVHELKKSDNLSAENILKSLSAQKGFLPASSKKGISIVNQYMSSLGIDTTQYRMVDGSGVSRYNLLSSDIIVQLLTEMHKNRKLFLRFYEALPVAGRNGTLQYRMTGTNCQGNLRAKTGTLNGTSCLAGYVFTKDGEYLVFSIMMENYLQSPEIYRNIQDKIGEIMSNYCRP